MIEEVTRKDTINKDTVHKMLKNNKAYLKGLEAERRELIQQLSDCQKQLADLELFADIQNEISISPHIDQAAVSNGHTGDPVGKLVCIRNTKYQSVERAIRHIYAELERNQMRAEAAFWIKYIYNLTQEILPLHYSIMHQLWFTYTGTYRQIALEERISNAKIRKILENEVTAVYVIVTAVIDHYEKDQITPELRCINKTGRSDERTDGRCRAPGYETEDRTAIRQSDVDRKETDESGTGGDFIFRHRCRDKYLSCRTDSRNKRTGAVYHGYIYAKLSSDQLMKLCDPKLDAKDMLQILLHTEASKGLTSAVNSIAAYMDELQEIKQEHAKEEKRLQDQLQEEEKKVRELEAEIEKLKTLQRKQEIRTDRKPEKRKRFGKQMDSGSFDLGSYIINAHLSAEQMEVLRYAIEKEIDDKLIRQMIYQKLPAEQLRNMVAVILTKRSMEKTEKEETDGQ